MDAERTIKRLGIFGVLFLAGVITLGLASQPDDPSGGPTRPVSGSTYSHETLQRDAGMTEQMSTPNADAGGSSHQDDAQLERSRDAGYVRALEEHQGGLDQMLAR